MRWLLRQYPATQLGSSHVEREFEKLREEGGGEAGLTDTMLLEVSPEQGLDLGFVYNKVERVICGIVKDDQPKEEDNHDRTRTQEMANCS